MKTLVFNLNGTLAASNESLDDEMVVLLKKLLMVHNVAIISGASWKHFNNKIITPLSNADLNKLYLLPTTGGSMYQVWGRYGWVATYQSKLDKRDVSRIQKAIDEAIEETGFEQPQRLWGKQVDDRETQITFCVLGHKAPLEEKEKWDLDCSKRKPLAEAIAKKLVGSYDVRISGFNSIDISLKDINKKYGIDELMKRLHISKDDVIYIGNAIFKGGDDYAAVEMGLDNVPVQDPEDTKKWIRGMLDGTSNVKLEKVG